jgi:hypothetical protein
MSTTTLKLLSRLALALAAPLAACSLWVIAADDEDDEGLDDDQE